MSDTIEESSIPVGFSFSSAIAGIKASGRPDLALIEAALGTTAAGLFTRNLVVAAPVVVGRAALAKSRGKVRAVIVNSGNANCATGIAGVHAARKVCIELARLLGTRSSEVFPSSTGIIGVPIPADKIIAKLPELFATRSPDAAAANKFAATILTTDTHPKTASATFRLGNKRVRLLGIAKGSGMIHPQLATMLVYLMTDIAANPTQLRQYLKAACADSFECISVDGDTSTNDTVLLLASGKSDVSVRSAEKPFTKALQSLCQSLAEQIVKDGEGVQHVIHLSIQQAKNREEALQIARAISHSVLVKTAWAGADPNWGRILAAIGRSGIAVDPKQLSIHIGDQTVCRRGAAFPFDQTEAHKHLSQPDCNIGIRLGRGRAKIKFITTDLTTEYVRINADYST